MRYLSHRLLIPDPPEPNEPVPAPPAPKPRKTGTSADEVTQEAERERKIKGLEERLAKNESENQTVKEQLAALMKGPVLNKPDPETKSNPVISFLREIHILE